MNKVSDLTDEVASLKDSDQEDKQRITYLEQQLELETTSAIIIDTWKMIQEFQDSKAEEWNARGRN